MFSSTTFESAPFGIDRAFKDFFRIGGFDFDQEVDEVVEQAQQNPATTPTQVIERLPLDRLSLLACDRQGLQPVELLRQDADQNKSAPPRATPRSGVAAMKRIAEAKLEAAAFRRMGKIRVAEAERRAIVAILTGVDAGTRRSEKLTKDENALLVQLRSQDAQALLRIPGAQSLSPEELEEYSLPCNDAAEADACDALMQWQSAADIQDKKHKAHMKKVQNAAAVEFEKMKAIQHRSAVAEVVDVLQRSAMEDRMRKKEREHHEFVEHRKEQRRQESQKAEQERHQKRQMCTQRFRETIRNRRHELEAKSQYRVERSQLVAKERDEELARRLAKKEEEATNARKRLDAVNQSIVEFRSTLEDELQARMELHGSNQTQLQLRQRAARNLKAAKDHVRAEMVDHMTAAQFEEQLQREHDAVEKEREIERRKEAVKQAALTRSHILASASEAAQKQAQSICYEDRLHREEKRKQLEAEYLAKDEQVRAAEENRKVDRLIRAELEAQRVENHEQNRKRVEKAMAFQQKLKAEIVAREEERDRQQRAAQEAHRKEMLELATQLYKEREQLAHSLDQSKAKFATMAATDMIDDAGAQIGSSGSLGRRRSSFGPSKSSILRQAEDITSRYMVAQSQESAQRSSSRARTSRPASASAHHQSAADSLDTTTTSIAENASNPTSKPTPAPRRPLSAVARRTPSNVDVSAQQTALQQKNAGKLGLAFEHRSPVVQRQLAAVDGLEDSALEAEERRRYLSDSDRLQRPPPGKQNRHVQSPSTPLAELVQRMDVLYHS